MPLVGVLIVFGLHLDDRCHANRSLDVARLLQTSVGVLSPCSRELVAFRVQCCWPRGVFPVFAYLCGLTLVVGSVDIEALSCPRPNSPSFFVPFPLRPLLALGTEGDARIKDLGGPLVGSNELIAIAPSRPILIMCRHDVTELMPGLGRRKFARSQPTSSPRLRRGTHHSGGSLYPALPAAGCSL